MLRLGVIACLVLATCTCLRASAAELRIGQTNATAGTSTSVPICCDAGSGVVAAQFDFSFNPSLISLTGITAGDALAGHIVDQQQLSPGRWRALLYSPANAVIETGAVTLLQFNISADAPSGIVPLALSNAILARTAGQRVQPLAQVVGAITVSSPADVLALAPDGGGQLQATIVGVPGRIFTLQGTTNLLDWADLGAYTNQSGTLVLTFPTPPGRDAYFYRTAYHPSTTPPSVPAPTLSDPALPPDGNTRLQLHSSAASAWRIEGSPDPFHWGNYGIVTNTTGTLVLTNTPIGNPGTYFHRVAQP